MALGFSSGLLTGLQTFGQGGGAIPADPRQRNAMQAAGVTNPLLQRFGQGLGGILGTEMRSPMEQFGSAIQGIDTSTPEGKKALLSALSKVDPIATVKMAEAFRMEELDAPKRAADLARIKAQTALAEKQAKYNNISLVKNVTTRDPITQELITKPQQFTITVDNEGKIPEIVQKEFGDIGITQDEVDKALSQEEIHYFIDDKDKRRVVSYTKGKPFEVIGDEKVEIDPETVAKWRGVGDIKQQAELPAPPPAGQAAPTTSLDLQQKENILRNKGGMLTNPIFAPYVR